MQKILYIAHSFHLQTASNRFLVEILKNHFEVEDLHFEPNADISGQILNINTSDYFAVVLVQLDYLAPLFISQGMRTIVVPMFDGSEHMPEEHWRIANQASFISFSRHLHAKINRAGCQSKLVKYFPEPVLESELPAFDSFHGFIWVRRPVDGVNLNTVFRLTGDQLQTLHVHDAPDDKRFNLYQHVPNFGNTIITRSTWFERKGDYQNLLKKCNVYFAPRMSEGIGMGFLEAMARGAVVFANNASTHNEYIANWVNGIIFDNSITSTPFLEKEKMKEISHSAWETVKFGRKDWIESIPKIVDFVSHTKRPERIELNLPNLSKNIIAAYGSGLDTYRSFLRRNSDLIHKIGLTSAIDDNDESPIVVNRTISNNILNDGNSIYFGGGGARDYLLSGWSHDEDEFVWINGKTASLEFSLVSEEKNIINSINIVMRAAARGETDWNVAVIFNDQFLGSQSVGTEWKKISFFIPQTLIKNSNNIKIYSSDSAYVNPDPRELSVAVKMLELSKLVPGDEIDQTG